tara:strand:+ start:1802 stop:2365 length:564 start_codon:yes stop_codon:yes gene_type:complete
MPSLWVDADACPRVAREIIVRAAERTQTPTWFVANHQVPLPPSPWVKPLAQEAIDKGAAVMTNRGETLDRGNIRARVQMRDFMETMRSSGEHTGGPKGYSDSELLGRRPPRVRQRPGPLVGQECLRRPLGPPLSGETWDLSGAGNRSERRSFFRDEECSAQGRVYSAFAKACPRVSRATPPGVTPSP